MGILFNEEDLGVGEFEMDDSTSYIETQLSVQRYI